MTGPEEGSRRILMAVAAGRVQRAPVTAGAAAGNYLLDGTECVDAALVSLVGNDLVYLPAGNDPPRLTPDGEWVLTNVT